MTCKELRLYFEDPLRRDDEFGPEAAHLAHCSDCARFVETQRGLAAGLRLICESVPRFPAALDEAVLSNYRRQVASAAVPFRSAAARPQWASLGWSVAAVAAVIMVTALLSLPGRRPLVQTESREPAIVSRAPSAHTESTTAAIKAEPVHSAENRTLQRPAMKPGIMREHPVAADFRSLIYCDELSCGGLLAVIRIRLPASDVALTPASNSASDTVLADVLVGSDGIARGIRIVQ